MKSWARNETRQKPQTWQKRAFPRIGWWQRGQSLGMAQEDRPMRWGLAISLIGLLLAAGCITIHEVKILDNVRGPTSQPGEVDDATFQRIITEWERRNVYRIEE